MAGAIQYAEDTLGVHTILEKAILARDEYSKILAELIDMKKEKRALELKLEMLELDISCLEHVAHPEMSATAMREHLKMAFYKKDGWRSLKKQISELASKIEEEEADRRLTEKDLDIANSRMTQMGGYLFYLGATRVASASTGK